MKYMKKIAILTIYIFSETSVNKLFVYACSYGLLYYSIWSISTS